MFQEFSFGRVFDPPAVWSWQACLRANQDLHVPNVQVPLARQHVSTPGTAACRAVCGEVHPDLVCSVHPCLALAACRAVFGEVYPDPVRVVSIGRSVEELIADPGNPSNRDFSIEFCGGTHLDVLGKALAFAITSEEGACAA